MAQKLLIVGSGIVGLSHALAAARRGWDVTVFDRDAAPRGATIRNFGMVWPIALAPGERLEIGLESRGIWDEVLSELDVWNEACGATFVAHTDAEFDVLREFAESDSRPVQLLEPSEVTAELPSVNPDGLRGGLRTSTELAVDPREVGAKLPAFLAQRHGVKFEFSTHVTHVRADGLTTAEGHAHHADRVIIASGTDMVSLRPHVFKAMGLRRCALQMLRVEPEQGFVPLATHLGGGLTMRHYPTFAECPSVERIRAEVRARDLRLDEFGIHVLVAQRPDGSLIIGDSHDYSESGGDFSSELVDDLLVRELHRLVNAGDLRVRERWFGRYTKEDDGFARIGRCHDGVLIAQVTGGLGMTISFGVAERFWSDRWDTTRLPDPVQSSVGIG